MTTFMDKLNLRPQERRLIMGVAIVVFVVLNFWLVWPNFGALQKVQRQTIDADRNLKRFTDEVNKKPQYEKELKVLEEKGVFVGSEEQALRFQQEVSQLALLSLVQVPRYDPSGRSGSMRTNSFFEEQTLLITVNTGEKELVDFLNSLGARNSLIRVRSMTLSRDQSQMRLQGTLTLVESFQKKAPPKTTVLAAAAPIKATNQTLKSTNKTAMATNQPAVPALPQAPKAIAPKATNSPAKDLKRTIPPPASK